VATKKRRWPRCPPVNDHVARGLAPSPALAPEVEDVVTLRLDEFFASANALPVADLDQIFGTGGIVVVAPHPDDETLGCGGLIALASQLGRNIQVVVISDGVGSHPNSRLYPPDKLRDLREGETRAALSALGAVGENLTFLRLPDRFVPSRGPEAQRAAAAIANVACAIDATALAVTWPHDPHCDHLAAWRLVRQACLRLHGGIRLLTYPIWGHILPSDTTFERAPIGHRLDVSSVVDSKRKAIRAHASQVSMLIADDPEGFVLMPEMLARFERPYELFLESKDCGALP
jgi:LmbE family N-acetylglucosaminyl deacetylase